MWHRMRLSLPFNGRISVSDRLLEISFNGYARAYISERGSVEYATCLPVPEKAQAQYMFCIFPLNADGINNHSSEDNETAEQIMWTVPNTILKTSQVSVELAIETEDTYKSLLLRVLNRCLAPFQKQVEMPNEKEFASQTAQVQKKGERAVHVKAFRGSKDGKYRFLVHCNEAPNAASSIS